jgi:hypothetical protein
MNPVLPPRYIRAINFENNGVNNVTVTATFETAGTLTLPIAPNGTTTIEKEVNHGSWTAVDQVQSFSVNVNGNVSNFTDAPEGVEIRTYNISADGTIARTQ